MKRIRIYNELFEQSNPDEDKPASASAVSLKDPSVKARPAIDSIDDQVDSLILRYENSSIRAEREDDVISESLSNLNLKFLFEQEDLDDEPLDDEEGGGDEGGEEGGEECGDDEAPEPGGSEDVSVTEPADSQAIPDLDVDAFTSRVVRLIMNYKNLLRIEDAIINRAKSFLDENYGDKFVNKYLETLENQYGLSASEDDVQYASTDDFGVGANPAGAGSMGGGGA